MRYLIPSILALLTLVACDTTASLSELQHIKPPENPYDDALKTQYQALAEKELRNYDWWSSQHFADKGLLAAEGKDVAPEDPAERDMSRADQETLRAARDELQAALTPEQKTARPRLSAKLMVSYDCWVENLEEGWNTTAIDACRNRFERALSRLTSNNDDALARAVQLSAGLTLAPVTVVPPTPDATDAPLVTATSVPEETLAATPTRPIETSSSIFYFPFDEDTLTGEALTALQNLIIDITNHGPTQIAINGHADRAGTDEYNVSLSERRARFILDQLLAAGVDPGMVSYYAFGETAPRVATSNGVPEAANRRAEIFIE